MLYSKLISKLISFILVPILYESRVETARILCIFPIPSFSHQIVFRAYTKELSRLGHELVIITPNPYLPIDRPKDNVTEVDVSFAYQSYKDVMQTFADLGFMVYGAAIDMEKADDSSLAYMIDIVIATQLESNQVKEILKYPKNHFDLLVIEAFFDYALIFRKFFNAPTIMMSSFYGSSDNYDTIGAVSRHPLYYPNMFRSNFDMTTFWGKFRAMYEDFKYLYLYKKLEIAENKMFREYYGSDSPTMEELRDKVDLLFINSHPIFDNNRPVPPNAVYLGSLHLQPVEKLPEDLKQYLDNSTSGVVYVSLGTNVDPKLMDRNLFNELYRALAALPYDVLWKYDGKLENKPQNVRIEKWLPQRDLLTHPNIKVFVTQGGRQSLDEAIDAKVPLVAIPIFADQFFNIKTSEEMGICQTVEFSTMTATKLSKAINNVIDDITYKQNIQKLNQIINDQPQTAMERAIWWTEYVLRHGGAKHLRPPLANVTWSEYLMLDVVVPVVIGAICLLLVVSVVTWYIVKVIKQLSKSNQKIKLN